MVKALVLGDSIAQGYDGHAVVSTPWPAYVANKLNWEVDNKSIGGTSAINGENSLLTRLEGFTYSDYDRIFLAYGTNDYGLSNVSLDDFNKGYERAIKYIKGSAPNAIVYLVMPIQSWLLTDSMDVPNNQGITQNQLCDVERSLAIRTGCLFYDWRDNPVVNGRNRTTYLGDSVLHPTQNTYNLLAIALIERMINMADLVKIFNGMDDGGGNIDKNFNTLNQELSNFVTSTGEQTSGVSALNGASLNGVYWSKETIGKMNILTISFQMNATVPSFTDVKLISIEALSEVPTSGVQTTTLSFSQKGKSYMIYTHPSDHSISISNNNNTDASNAYMRSSFWLMWFS